MDLILPCFLLWSPKMSRLFKTKSSKQNGCKIVFTTRSRELCEWVDVEVQVKCLSEEEACDLFRKTLGKTMLMSDREIPKLTKILARSCCGLPLVLSVISKTMACKKMVGEWYRAIHVLHLSTPKPSGMEDEMLPILKFAYDSLPDENTRLCFLYCSLFEKISKQDLVDCWIGEGMIEAKDREIAEIKSYGMMGELVRMGLLMEDESGYGVKMHDVVREMAMWIAADEGWQKEHFFVVEVEEIHEVDDWRMVTRRMLTRMSITSSQIENISDSPHCSDLKTLFLRGNRNLKLISGDFFWWMTSLVLLDMSHNTQLSELPEEVSCLFSLQFLNLSCTSIRLLPHGLKQLKRLIHLDLDYTSDLQEIDVIASLLNLQVVRLFHSVPMDISLLRSLQLLKSLKELSLTVEEDAVLQRLLSSHLLANCIRRLCLRGTSIANGGILSLEAMFSLRELDIARCDIQDITFDWRSTIEKETTVHFRNIENIPQFSNIRRVSLSYCKGLKDLTWLLFAPRLGDLFVSECPQIEQIISRDKAMGQLGHMSEQPFQNLTRLELCGLPELESIYWTPLPFPVLVYLKISYCPKLRRLPFNSDQVEMRLEEGVEWEDEATRLSNFSISI